MNFVTVIALALLTLPSTSTAVSKLPPCEGDSRTWNECFGEIKSGPVVVYAGEWKAGEPHGQGVFTFPNGNRYIGQFQNGRQHGRGTLVFIEGGSQSGTWVDGKREGEFIWSMPNRPPAKFQFSNDSIVPRQSRVDKPDTPCQQPEYPIAARRSGAEGTVVVAYTMEVDGSISEAVIEKPSGPTREHRLLDAEVLKAVLKCTGKPGTVDGAPTKMKGRVQYVYRLQ